MLKVTQTMMNAETEQLFTTLSTTHPVEEKDYFEVVECLDLDNQHRGWLKTYLNYCQASLQREVERPIPDLTMVGFFRRELLKYHELLARI